VSQVQQDSFQLYDNDSWRKLHAIVRTENAFFEVDVFLPENGFTLFQITKITDQIEYHKSIYFLHITSVEGAKKQIGAIVESLEGDL
ncbi:MAG: hypothetical protein ABEK04_03095, partial [Candidatus Nanohalobium sp.]